MAELQDFESRDIAKLLGWAFRICKENAGALDLTSAGSKSGCRQLDKLLGLKEAAKVVAFVDNRLEPVERALVRYIFGSAGDSDENVYFNVLHNWLWAQCLPWFSGLNDEVIARYSVLRIQVPFEVRAHAVGARSFLSSYSLAGYLGISQTGFMKCYRANWLRMVDRLDSVRNEAFNKVDDWLLGVLELRNGPVDTLDDVTEQIAALMSTQKNIAVNA